MRRDEPTSVWTTAFRAETKGGSPGQGNQEEVAQCTGVVEQIPKPCEPRAWFRA